jgi:hypothetical protein
MGTKVFWIEPTDRERRWLRRYRSSAEHKCPANGSYCNAMFELGEADVRYTAEGYIDSCDDLKPADDDARWPTNCEVCGQPFDAADPHQLFGRQIYVRPDTGERFTLEDAPPGACWDAWWFHRGKKGDPESPRGSGYHVGPDGRTLIVKCPDGHEWMIDGRASNCTMKDDMAHFCWVRHGRPEDGNLHVDKNGPSCSAGGGSIDTGKWHGHLHNGELVP